MSRTSRRGRRRGAGVRESARATRGPSRWRAGRERWLRAALMSFASASRRQRRCWSRAGNVYQLATLTRTAAGVCAAEAWERSRRDGVPAPGGAADQRSSISPTHVDGGARRRRARRAAGGRHRSRRDAFREAARAQPRARRPPAASEPSPASPRSRRSTTNSSAPRGLPAPRPRIATASPRPP